MPALALAAPVWVGLGVVIVVCGLRARSSLRALEVGCRTVAVLWVVAGAGYNAAALWSGADYSGFADAADVRFVTRTWESLVVPHHGLFIGLLVVFEAAAGLLALARGRPRQVALLALIAFDVLLLSFGWAYVFWSLPIASALALLLRAELGRAGTAGSQRGVTQDLSPAAGPRS